MKVFLTAFLSLVAVQHAYADTCKRWVNDIDPCAGIVKYPECAGSPTYWTPNQWINYKNWNYSGTPEDACRKVVQKEIDPDSPTEVERVDDDYYYCYWDWDEDGDVDSVDKSGGRRAVHRDDIQKDQCCSRVPNKSTSLALGTRVPPYSKVADDGFVSHDGQFSPEHRTRILKANPGYTVTSTETTVTSDAKYAGVSDPGAANGPLRVTRTTTASPDDPLDSAAPPTLFPSTSDTANVDHMIPRVDSNGCSCGSNTSDNALVISAALNTKMGRNCLDPNRVAILETFTHLPATARAVAPMSEPEVVTPSIELDSGCSTGTGQAGGLLLVLGCMLGIGRARKR